MSVSFIDRAVSGVQVLRPYEPGKPVEELQRELGLSDIIKLASNENPLGPSPAAARILQSVAPDIASYPDGNGFALKRRLAEHLDIGPDHLTLGNGSNDVLDLLGRVFLGPGRGALFSDYAFAVYSLVTRAACADPKVVPAYPPSADMPLGHDLDGFAAALDDSVRLVFIANPNNPTGTWLAPEAIATFMQRVPEDVVVVLDEAYREYMTPALRPDVSELLAAHRNLVITRSFSKIYGLAGLRIGYAIADPEITDLLNRVRQPFNANCVAQAAARAALNDDEHIQRSAGMNREGVQWLRTELTAEGLATLPSEANFITLDLERDAQPVFQALLREGVIVRPLGGYGLPTRLRVTVGTESQNRRFMQALRRVRAHI